MFARPSVQRITEDPGAPYAAIAMAVVKAGPKAVGPVSSNAIIFFYRAPFVSLIAFDNLFPPSAIPF
jgi:hypothetical protein